MFPLYIMSEGMLCVKLCCVLFNPRHLCKWLCWSEQRLATAIQIQAKKNVDFLSSLLFIFLWLTENFSFALMFVFCVLQVKSDKMKCHYKTSCIALHFLVQRFITGYIFKANRTYHHSVISVLYSEACKRGLSVAGPWLNVVAFVWSRSWLGLCR